MTHIFIGIAIAAYLIGLFAWLVEHSKKESTLESFQNFKSAASTQAPIVRYLAFVVLGFLVVLTCVPWPVWFCINKYHELKGEL